MTHSQQSSPVVWSREGRGRAWQCAPVRSRAAIGRPWVGVVVLVLLLFGGCSVLQRPRPVANEDEVAPTWWAKMRPKAVEIERSLGY